MEDQVTEQAFRDGHPCTVRELANIVQAHGPIPDALDPRKWTGDDESWWHRIALWMTGVPT